jgi:hypothetical protein
LTEIWRKLVQLGKSQDLKLEEMGELKRIERLFWPEWNEAANFERALLILTPAGAGPGQQIGSYRMGRRWCA